MIYLDVSKHEDLILLEIQQCISFPVNKNDNPKDEIITDILTFKSIFYSEKIAEVNNTVGIFLV